MRAVPVPDGVAEAMGGAQIVIGEADPTRVDVRPCEYVVTESELYPGRPRVWVFLVLDDEDRRLIANGAMLRLSMDGGELPWSLDVVPTEGPAAEARP